MEWLWALISRIPRLRVRLLGEFEVTVGRAEPSDKVG